MANTGNNELVIINRELIGYGSPIRWVEEAQVHTFDYAKVSKMTVSDEGADNVQILFKDGSLDIFFNPESLHIDNVLSELK